MISVVIIVKNERGIENTIRKINSIPKPEKTEILVIDASGGNLDDISKMFPKVRWIPFRNTNLLKKYTIPEQRNLGIKLAKGDIIVFIDANCIPMKNWLIEIVSPIRKNKENVIAGLVKSTGGKSIWDGEQEKIGSKKYIRECSTLNMAFNKDITKKVGYFDERFNYGSDMDFTWRIIDAGYRIRYSKKAVIYHDWGNFKKEIKRSVIYGEARVVLYTKHTSRLTNFLNYYKDPYTPFTFFFFLYILFLPIALIYPYYLIFILIPIIKNVKHRPFENMLIYWSFGLGLWKGLALLLKRKVKYNFANKYA